MQESNFGTCEICGKEAVLTRIYEHFSFPCVCHSPEHFMLRDMCDDCLQRYHIDPDMECTAQVTVETFNLFLKAHGKYGLKYNHRLTCEDIHPEYVTDDTPYIKIKCTYEMMCYLGKIYSEYQYDQAENEPTE